MPTATIVNRQAVKSKLRQFSLIEEIEELSVYARELEAEYFQLLKDYDHLLTPKNKQDLKTAFLTSGVAVALTLLLSLNQPHSTSFNSYSATIQLNVQSAFNGGSIEWGNDSKQRNIRVQKDSTLVQSAFNNGSIESSLNVQLNSDQKITAFMHAIIGQESNGKFYLVNPHSGALGYGQVMPENVKSWTLEALGYSLTSQEFLQSPKMQIKVIKHQLTKAYNSQNVSGRSEEEVMRRVASIWYSGQAKLWNNTKPQYYDGHPYPSIAEYTASVYKKYQAELAKTPIAPAVARNERHEVRSETPNVVQSKLKTKAPNAVRANVKPQASTVVQPEFTPANLGVGNLLLGFFKPKQAEAATTTDAQKIVAYMESQGYKIFRGAGEVNIVHIRKGSIANNKFEDKRLTVQFVNGIPTITGEWAETTKPGLNIVHNPVNPKGAFAIAPGQYRAWQVGTHVGGSGRHAHEALIQTGGAVTGYRDSDRNRTFETIDRGWYGINIHEPWSNYFKVEDRSAGCLVTSSKKDHRAFMRIIKSDPRFAANPNFVFSATVIEEGKL